MAIDSGYFAEDTNVPSNKRGCDYCVADRDGFRVAFGAYYISNNGGEWRLHTGHCKPREIRFCPMCGRELRRGE